MDLRYFLRNKSFASIWHRGDWIFSFWSRDLSRKFQTSELLWKLQYVHVEAVLALKVNISYILFLSTATTEVAELSTSYFIRVLHLEEDLNFLANTRIRFVDWRLNVRTSDLLFAWTLLVVNSVLATCLFCSFICGTNDIGNIKLQKKALTPI